MMSVSDRCISWPNLHHTDFIATRLCGILAWPWLLRKERMVWSRDLAMISSLAYMGVGG